MIRIYRMGPPPGNTAILSKANFGQETMAALREEAFSWESAPSAATGSIRKTASAHPELERISLLDILTVREQ